MKYLQRFKTLKYDVCMRKKVFKKSISSKIYLSKVKFTNIFFKMKLHIEEIKSNITTGIDRTSKLLRKN